MSCGHYSAEPQPSRCPRILGPHWFPQLRYTDCNIFLCDDRGRLLPHVRKSRHKKANHWGLPNTYVLGDAYNLSCSKKRKRSCRCNVPKKLSISDMPSYYQQRQPLAECEPLPNEFSHNHKAKRQLNKAMNDLRHRAPPVVWVMGYASKAISCQRKGFAKALADNLGLTFIDPEEILTALAIKYFDYPTTCHCRQEFNMNHFCGGPQNQAGGGGSKKKEMKKNDEEEDEYNGNYEEEEYEEDWEQDEEGQGQEYVGYEECTNEDPILAGIDEKSPNVQLILELLKDLLFYQENYAEALNLAGVMEIVKLLLVTYPAADGYLVYNFPVNLEEAEKFESTLWPVSAILYFVSKTSTKYTRICGGLDGIDIPQIFQRSEEYSELLVEQIAEAGDFSFKTVKVPNAECIGEWDVRYIRSVVGHLIYHYMETRKCINAAIEVQFIDNFIDDEVEGEDQEDNAGGFLKSNKEKTYSSTSENDSDNIVLRNSKSKPKSSKNHQDEDEDEDEPDPSLNDEEDEFRYNTLFPYDF